MIAGMISVIIPTFNAQKDLGPTLAALVPAAIRGLVSEVIVADGGSTDETTLIAEAAGATILRGTGGRGPQLRAGAEAARCRWLLFLHADTRLDESWEAAAETFIREIEQGARPQRAAAFRFALDDHGIMPRVLEALVALRCALFKLPYGDQGLLMSRSLYDAVGGFQPLPLMEDVDMIRRLGRSRVAILAPRAVTSPVRYRREGYLKRMARNVYCLALFYLNVPVSRIVRIYGQT